MSEFHFTKLQFIYHSDCYIERDPNIPDVAAVRVRETNDLLLEFPSKLTDAEIRRQLDVINDVFAKGQRAGLVQARNVNIWLNGGGR